MHRSGTEKDMGSEVDLITLSLAFYDPHYDVVDSYTSRDRLHSPCLIMPTMGAIITQSAPSLFNPYFNSTVFGTACVRGIGVNRSRLSVTDHRHSVFSNTLHSQIIKY